MGKGPRQKLPGGRRAGRRPRRGSSTEPEHPVNTTRGCDTERRGRVAGALTVRMSREIPVACGRFPSFTRRVLG